MAEQKLALKNALSTLLTPIVRICLYFKISHSEFVDVAKRIYIAVAYRYFRIPGRKQTYSRVSVLTGIPRKEVVRLIESDEYENVKSKGPRNRATQVISGWIREPQYQDEQGEPRVLTLRGESPSFEDLVERYSGDITARAILDELLTMGIVERVDKNTVKLVAKGYVPQSSDSEKFLVLSQHCADLMATGGHNIMLPAKDAYFQRQVTYSELPESVMGEFKQYSMEKSLELLIDFDKWLSDKKEQVEAKPGEALHRIGIGVYFIDNDKEPARGKDNGIVDKE